MRILCLNPPAVPSYFNAGHHLPLFQCAAYLRAQGHAVRTVDFALLNATWRDMCRALHAPCDVIALFNDFDAIDGLSRAIAYCREFQPGARLMTFGRASRQCPGFFEQFDLDAVVASGDYEAGLQGYIDTLRSDRPKPGLHLRTAQGWTRTGPGRFLPADAWVMPEPLELPLLENRALYHNDLDKFCGLPRLRELVIPVARGCPVGCGFCDVPFQQGLKERRVSVPSVMGYIERAETEIDFDYVSFYAPTFTLKRNWVLELCEAFSARERKIPWKCVTTLEHLSEALLVQMGAAGCVRVSVGIETLAAQVDLPSLKHSGNARLDEIAEACRMAGVELNCFLVFGLPGETVDDAIDTMNRLIARGFRVRPTVLAPYDRMHMDMSLADFQALNRQIFVHPRPDAAARRRAYTALYANPHDRESPLSDRILDTAGPPLCQVPS